MTITYEISDPDQVYSAEWAIEHTLASLQLPYT